MSYCVLYHLLVTVKTNVSATCVGFVNYPRLVRERFENLLSRSETISQLYANKSMKIFGVPVLGRVETGTCQTAIVEFHLVQSGFKGMCPINVQTNSLDAPK